MAHVFDTGLDKPQRTKIRDALIARLASLKISAGLYLQNVVTIPRPIRGDGDDLGLGALEVAAQAQAPTVAIALGGAKVKEGSEEAIIGQAEIEFALYVISKHGRAMDAGRLYGDAIAAASNTADPGVFVMLEHIRERVHGQDLGVSGVDVPRWKLEDELITEENITIWEQRYSVLVSVEINPDRAETEVMTSIEAEHEGDGITGVEDNPIVTTITPLDP